MLAQRALTDDIINETEAQLLINTEAGRLRTISVDDFAPEELVAHYQVEEHQSVNTISNQAS